MLTDFHFMQVKKMKTSVPQNLLWYCFQSIYVDTILVDGYDFDPNTTWRTIHFVESVSVLFLFEAEREERMVLLCMPRLVVCLLRWKLRVMCRPGMWLSGLGLVHC